MIFLLVLLSFSKNINGANILFANTLSSGSHQIWNYALASGLMEKGHNITMIGPQVDFNEATDKYHPIVFEASEDNWEFQPNDCVHQNLFVMMKTFSDSTYAICQHYYGSKNFNNFLNNSESYKFDLIIFDVTVGPCLHPLIKVFNYPPTIGVTAFLLPPEISLLFGNHLHPSYLPHYFLNSSDEMSSFTRLKNYLITYLDGIKVFLDRFKYNTLMKEKFGEHMDSVDDLESHVSLLLSNTNPIFDYPQPLPPNIIPVGGLHIKSSPLPKDFQEIMQNAKEGVIVFSLGTNVRSDKLDAEKRGIFLEAFNQLKQTVIWKFESELENLPKNVILRKWLPQGDLLGHQNAKLLISHGGALSVQEASYHGIPVIGIPFYADQKFNSLTLMERKRGLYLDFNEITVEKLLESIHELLENPIYAENMRNVSERYKDLPMKPLETAVFWAEYAMKHNGAKFLNTRARSMSSFVAEGYDVIAYLLAPMIIIVILKYYF